jgi:hypothetical protein
MTYRSRTTDAWRTGVPVNMVLLPRVERASYPECGSYSGRPGLAIMSLLSGRREVGHLS